MIEATGAIAPNNAPPARPRLEYWPLDRLVPSPRNARTHSGQVAEIAGSIRAFGFTNPILAGEDGDVIAGHGRLRISTSRLSIWRARVWRSWSGYPRRCLKRARLTGYGKAGRPR